ncbi:MAG TPA: tetratricopeptide repeat protein, partial [Alphaproteobacteria bacterium]
MRSALVMVICLLLAACASAPAPRPLASGFGAGGGVADPYADGKRHLAEGNDELAAQRFGQALAQDGRTLDALNGLGVAYTRLGRFDSAGTQFERALQIDPTDAATLNNYGWTLMEQGRLREARAFLELARRHATEAEARVIAANLEKLQHAQPPALLGALEAGPAAQTSHGPHQLIRMADNAYLLETGTEVAEGAPPSARPDPQSPPVMVRAAGASGESPPLPDPRPMPSVVEGRDRTDALAHPAKQPRATPHPGVLKKSGTGGAPIRLFPPLAS